MFTIHDVITMGSNTVDAFVETEADLLTIDHSGGEQEELLGYEYGEKILIEKLEFNVGGSATNAASSFARLGLQTAYLGKVGNDSNGSKVLEKLESEGIDFVGSRGGTTGYSVILDSDHEDRTILTYKGSNNDLGFDEIDVDELDADWFYFTTMMGTSFQTMKELARVLDERDAKIAFNPSSYLAKKGYEGCDPVLKHVDVLILNREEGKELAGEDTVKHAMRSLKEHVDEYVVITDGGDGAYLYDGDDVIRGYPSENHEVVETTGAGDAFSSGFIAGLIAGEPVERSFRRGFIQAEHVIQEYGARAGLLTKEEMSDALASDNRSITRESIEVFDDE